MAGKDYNVYKGIDGKWRGERQDSDRASVVANTQEEAFEATREYAKNNRSEVSIHRGDNNRIRAKHSYGNDPKGNG